MYKFYVGFLVLVIMLFIQFLFSLNPYILIIFMVLAFTYIWYVYDQHHKLQNRIENNELLNTINIKNKDANLKNKQLMTVVSSIPFPMLLMDEKGAIVIYNKHLTTFAQNKMYQNATYLHNGLPQEVQQFLKDAFILEKKLEERICIEEAEFQAISIPVLSKAKFIGCFIMFQDLTKALEGEKMQKRFIADVSHELKTPIAVIKGMLEILNRDDFDDIETQKEFLNQMEQETCRLEQMVKDMLDLSRLSIADPLLHRSKVDISLLLKDCITSLKEIADVYNVSLKTSFHTDEFVFCDPIRIRQVGMNLLMNGMKHGGNEICIETYVEGPFYIFSIHDDGEGIAKEEQTKIFDRFYRVDEARTRDKGGSGLGLAIVKSIVEAHKGKIELQSEKGKGTTFIVKLKRELN